MVFSWLLSTVVAFTTNPAVLLVHGIGLVLWSSVIGSGQVKLRSCFQPLGLSEALLLVTWLLGYLQGLHVVIVTYIWLVVFEVSTPRRYSVKKGATFVKGESFFFQDIFIRACTTSRLS